MHPRLTPVEEERKELKVEVITHLEFYPCYESGRGEVNFRHFLAKAMYTATMSKGRYEIDTRQYLDICEKSEGEYYLAHKYINTFYK